MSLYQRFNYPSKGYCRLCGRYDRLTNEHIPPESCFNHQDYFITNNPEGNERIHTKGGIKFKTICRICNNEVISLLDQELAKLIKGSELFLGSSKRFGIFLNDYRISFNKIMILKCLIAKVIVSYFPPSRLSEKVEDSDFVYTDRLRKVFNLDENLLSSLRVYFWINQAPYLAIIPGLSIIGELGEVDSIIVSSYLKFYPISFWIIEKDIQNRLKIDLPFFDFHSDDELIEINLKDLPKKRGDFPLDTPPTNGAYMMSTMNTIFAFPNEHQKIYIRNKIVK